LSRSCPGCSAWPAARQALGRALKREAERLPIYQPGQWEHGEIARRIDIAGGSSIAQIAKFFQYLVTQQSFASGTGQNLATNMETLGKQIYNTLLAPVDEALAQIGEDLAALFLHDVFLVPLELAYDGSDFFGLKYAVSNWLSSWHPLPTRGGHDWLISPRQDRLGALVVGPEDWGLTSGFAHNRAVDRFEFLRRTSVADLRFRVEDGQYDVLHFSCHGRFDDEHPEKGFLTLDESRGQDSSGGRLTGSQLASWQLNGALVFLNACQSGTVGQSRSGLVGFAEDVIRAGASHCVSMLWSVPDEGAALFASEFYREAFQGDPLGRALRDARRRYWGARSDVVTCLAYILFGDPGIGVGGGARAGG
jgi:hypothetical protein